MNKKVYNYKISKIIHIFDALPCLTNFNIYYYIPF